MVLVPGSGCDLLVKLEDKANWVIKFLNFELSLACEKRRLQVNVVDEWCLMAYEKSELHKEWSKH